MVGSLTYPLWLILLSSFGYGDRVFKDTIIGPQLEFLERGATGKQIQDAANESFLMAVQLNTRCGVDVGVLDIQI